MTEEQRRDIVRHWWMKAEESLNSAKREYGAGSHSFSINRVYYCCFYAVSAALLDRRLSFKKHVAVRTAFHKEFIKNGTLDVAWGKFYDQLFEDRQMGDYLPLKTFTAEYVESQIERCAEFLKAVRPFVQSL